MPRGVSVSSPSWEKTTLSERDDARRRTRASVSRRGESDRFFLQEDSFAPRGEGEEVLGPDFVARVRTVGAGATDGGDSGFYVRVLRVV